MILTGPTPTPKTAICPLCRLVLAPVGRVVSFQDTAGHWFTFEICLRCTMRLERLPFRVQLRQLDTAVGNLWRHPERYDLTPHDTEAEAILATKLRASQLRGEF